MSDGSEIDDKLDRGLALHRGGKIAEAEDIYRAALDDEPDNARAHHLLGLIALQTGNPENALTLFQRSISLDPGQSAALCDLGATLQRLGNLEDAADAFRQALEIDDTSEPASLNLGAVLTQLLRFDEAEVILTRAVERHPDSALAHNGLGNLFREKQELANAMAAYRTAIELDPDYAVAWSNAGVVLRELGDYAESLRHFEMSIGLDDGNPECFKNMAHALTEIGRYAAAEKALGRSLMATPEDAQAHTNLAHILMMTGRWEEGWREYRWRHRRSGGEPGRSASLWQGQDFPQETILVLKEQGVGDQILHAGLIPALQARGGRVIFECDARLQTLLSRAQPDVCFVADGSDVAARYYLPMADLVSQLGPHPASIPFPSRFMAPDPGRVKECRDYLSSQCAEASMRIGISWRSSQRNVGRSKTMNLTEWGPIFGAVSAVFVDLQYGDTTKELETVQQEHGVKVITDPTIDIFEDLDGLAAIIDSLDLVITASNVTAHLAAALGKEVWLAVKLSPFWYWAGDGSTTPLFPTVRAFRQERAGDWKPIIAAIAEDLTQHAANR
ncbi:MAG: tetratricopeptide repeat protein [Proteobacteria bacterium]|nr:tetratricopeptide repeat protein [Pseudomonadota bacterium]